MIKLLKWAGIIMGIAFIGFIAYAAYMVNFALKVNYIQIGLEDKFDTERPEVPELVGDTKVLFFSKTAGYRHYDAIEAADKLFSELAEKNNWALYSTENGAVFNTEDLDKFDVIVWQNVSGDVLTETQRAAFKAWVEEGGSWFGMHGAGGDREYAWDWYQQDLLRAQFVAHNKSPQFLTADVVKDTVHPTTDGIDDVWRREDEYYTFVDSVRDRSQVLFTLDEKTVSANLDYPMGEDHPLAWTHKVGQGTSLYSALGHRPQYYSEPKFIQFIEQSVNWLAEQNQR